MKAYWIEYAMTETLRNVKGIQIIAKNAADAYDKAVYEEIPKVEGTLPYAAYVHSVTYNNGKYHVFTKNLFGKAY